LEVEREERRNEKKDEETVFPQLGTGLYL